MAKILVVEDERSLLSLLVSILEEGGHEVLTATNGKQALNVIEENKPILVISDVMMPVMDGYALLSAIRDRTDWHTIKVVLVSAAPIVRGGRAQADQYLSKPYDLNAIEEAVANFTGQV